MLVEQAHSRQAGECIGRWGLCERRFHGRERPAAQVVDRIDELEPSFSDEADPIRDVLHLGQDVRREEDRPATADDLRDELVERLLHERIEPTRRLVEHEQVGVVHERLDETDLLPVPARELLDPAAEVEVEPCGKLVGARDISRTPRRCPKKRSSSRPVIRSYRRRSPGRYPSRRRIATLSRLESSPNTLSLPPVGLIRSSRRRIVVVFPAPFGPRNPNTSPASTEKSTSAMPRFCP